MSVIDAIIARKLCGGGSVPKPLTYDYMPEGYPTKTMGTVTLMEEQEVAFSLMGDAGPYVAALPSPLEIVGGQTYTVKWDGTEYECVGTNINQYMALGNQSIDGENADTGEPFLYIYNISQQAGVFETFDKSASHTISVKTVQEVVTPMAEEFLPTKMKNTTVFYL